MTAMERIEELERRVAELERQFAHSVDCRPGLFDGERQPTSGNPLPPNPVIIP